MSDSFRETDTILFRNLVTFQTGFGVVADEPFNIGSTSTTSSVLNTFNQINPYGGISGYIKNTGFVGINGIIVNTGANSTVIINGTNLLTNTGNQNVNGATNFNNNVIFYDDADGNNQLYFAPGSTFQTYDTDGLLSTDFNNRLLINGNSNTSIDWQNLILSGNWNAQSLKVSGYSVVTSNQTGNFGAGTSNLSGAYLFNTIPISGNNNQFISFPTALGTNPYVIPKLNNISGGENIEVWASGITSSGYWAQFSNTIDNSGYVLTTLASISTTTGLATTVIYNNNSVTNTGTFITTGTQTQITGSLFQTGINISGLGGTQIILSGNNVLISGGSSVNTGQLTGSFYPLNSNPSGYFSSFSQSYFNNGTITGSSPVININWASGIMQYATLSNLGTGNLNFTNGVPGGRYVLGLQQDSTGAHIINYNITGVNWGINGTPTQTTGVLKTDILTFVYFTGYLGAINPSF